MKKIFSLMILGCLMGGAAVATESPVLSTVNYQLQAKQWVSTNSAQVILAVNATAKSSSLAKIQAQILHQLSEVSSSVKWHVSQFLVRQDESGLQTLSWQITARLPQAKVNTLQQKIASFSRAGLAYKVQSVSFSPSVSEYQAAQADLRQKLYQQAVTELKRLNQDFSGSHYFLHKITFSTAPAYFAANRQVMALAKMPAQPNVGRELTLSASVELASVPPKD